MRHAPAACWWIQPQHLSFFHQSVLARAARHMKNIQRRRIG